jgi:hypothetical protein
MTVTKKEEEGRECIDWMGRMRFEEEGRRPDGTLAALGQVDVTAVSAMSGRTAGEFNK